MVRSAIAAAISASIYFSLSGIKHAHGFSAPSFSRGAEINIICRSSSVSNVEADANGRRESRSPLSLSRIRRGRSTLLSGNLDDYDDDTAFHHHGANSVSNNNINRHRFLSNIATTLLLPSFLATITSIPNPSYALVKGNAPPPKMKPPSSYSTSTGSSGNGNEGISKCRNVEECQELAERAEVALMQREAERAALGPKPQIVNGRTRYLDVVVAAEEDGGGGGSSGSSAGDTKRLAKMGDTITIYYKVLKLGKRSYDGLSGEGTVVFSRGYALEDDEKVLGDKSFTFVLGDEQVIQALNDAIPGMAVGSTRRISVTPQSGWEKNTPSCDGGPGGKGAGGDLRTDYVVVPTATMVEQEACFDRSKLPFPSTYAQERRMAQRFDQSLIMEVKLVNAVS